MPSRCTAKLSRRCTTFQSLIFLIDFSASHNYVRFSSVQFSVVIPLFSRGFSTDTYGEVLALGGPDAHARVCICMCARMCVHVCVCSVQVCVSVIVCVCLCVYMVHSCMCAGCPVRLHMIHASISMQCMYLYHVIHSQMKRNVTGGNLAILSLFGIYEKCACSSDLCMFRVYMNDKSSSSHNHDKKTNNNGRNSNHIIIMLVHKILIFN